MGKKRHFEERIKILREYSEEFGNLDIKQDQIYKGVKIGLLVANIRRERKNDKLLEEEVEILTSLGFLWSGQCTADQKIPILIEWVKIHGSLANLNAYSTMEVDGKTVNIGAVVAYFRRLNMVGKLPLAQKLYLKSLGFPFVELGDTYADLIDYYNKYGSVSKLKNDTVYVYKGKKHNIGKQVVYIIKRFKEGKLSETEYQFFNKLGVFDKWKRNKLYQYNQGKLSDEEYRQYRLSEIDPDTVHKGI